MIGTDTFRWQGWKMRFGCYANTTSHLPIQVHHCTMLLLFQTLGGKIEQKPAMWKKQYLPKGVRLICTLSTPSLCFLYSLLKFQSLFKSRRLQRPSEALVDGLQLQGFIQPYSHKEAKGLKTGSKYLEYRMSQPEKLRPYIKLAFEIPRREKQPSLLKRLKGKKVVVDKFRNWTLLEETM